MLVLKLAYMGELDFIKELQDLKTLFKEKGIVIGLVEQIEGDTHIIKVLCDEEKYSEKVYERIKTYISDVLYKMVIKNYKEKELFQFLKDTYFFLKQDEILEVEKKIMDTFFRKTPIEDEGSIYCENKINSIIEKIKTCLEENNELNINGFITFRMRELREEIEEVIDKVIEKYMAYKEYLEFIKLLKYFVDMQESKMDKIYITIEEGNRYRIEDEGGKDIYDEFLKELNNSKIGLNANIEDIIISGLITNAPKEIVIQGKENSINAEFLTTIEKVFEKKVFYLK